MKVKVSKSLIGKKVRAYKLSKFPSWVYCSKEVRDLSQMVIGEIVRVSPRRTEVARKIWFDSWEIEIHERTGAKYLMNAAKNSFIEFL